MRTEKVRIDQIRPYRNNAKIHTKDQVEQIAQSILEFGYNDPIAIDEDNVIIEGHGRWQALKQLAATNPAFKTIDVIRLGHLSDEQKKAYILAHNQLTLNTGYDESILNLELGSIIDIDMGQFGFELPGDLVTVDHDADDSEEDDFHRDNTYKMYNLDMIDTDRTTGYYQMPTLEKCAYIPKDLIGFNYMMSSKAKNVGVHCFVDDYQFERLWNNPHKYLDKILEYDAFLTPDFSLYLDMPRAMKIWNVFRSRLIGQLLQDYGMEVIPTISWAEKETFDFCFDGVAQGSVVAVSTVGVKQSDQAAEIWRQGMDEMIKRIQPPVILVYGGAVDYDYHGVEVRYYDNKVTERLRATDNKTLETNE